jgi:hypothetical protein
VLIGLLVSTPLFAKGAQAAGGGLDHTFGWGGVVTTAIGNSESNGGGVAIQADGKILVTGSAATDGQRRFAFGSLSRKWVSGSRPWQGRNSDDSDRVARRRRQESP